MLAERLIRQNATNVKNLSIEAPVVDDRLFVPERDVPSELKRIALGWIQQFNDASSWQLHTILPLAHVMKQLFPQEKIELLRTLQIERNLQIENEELLKDAMKKWEPFVFLEYAMAEHVFFPDVSKEDLLPENQRKLMIEEITKYQRFRQWDYYIGNAASMRSFFPKTADELLLNDETWRGVKESYEIYLGRPHLENALSRAACIRKLFPEKFDQLPLDNKTIQDMKEEVSNTQGSDILQSVRNYTYLALITADDIVFTDKGVEWVSKPPPQFKNSISQMPEMRKF